MNRSEVLKAIVPIISDELVICNVGLPSQELFLFDDQPSNFYMLGAMGLCSSIGLGLALSQYSKVIAIEGDGSILTNLGALPTIANNVANNFVLFIIDNSSYGSTGDQPTYTGKKTSLTGVAAACGCECVVECQAEDAPDALRAAMESDRMTVIVCKCQPGNIPVSVIELSPVTIRDRFVSEVERRAVKQKRVQKLTKLS
ncbi:MAG: sulfopyruvate decarboxylase subunit beta [Magnetovibrio sp.]|nr:sulfopyruvate decarboxylase subunit beta [Magnetovibrio sp.]|tara:strand:+ start:807 stop:1406 length:600 start_codon:yes stop_codon:yes gene_type:complete